MNINNTKPEAGKPTHFMFAPIRKKGDPTLPVWSDTPLPEVAHGIPEQDGNRGDKDLGSEYR